MSPNRDLLDQLMEGRDPGNLFGAEGLLSELTKAVAQPALSTALDEHLNEQCADRPTDQQDHPANRRNGSSQKTVTANNGKVVLDPP